MQRVKIFSSAAYDDDLTQLERAIGEWMGAAARQIQFVAQSALGAHLVVTFLYVEAGTQTAVTAEGEVEVPEVFERTLDDATLDPERPDDRPLPELELPY